LKKYINILILVFFSFLGKEANAQAASSDEIGVLLAAANYYGDINTNFNFNYLRPATAIFYRRNFNQYFSGKILASYAQVGGKDQLVNNAFQQTRNLAFKSDIWEASGQLELNFKKYAVKDLNRYFAPYLNLGISVFRFNPKTTVQDETYDLQQYGTEGQENTDISGKKPYDLIAFALPIGLGFKYWIGGQWTFGMDVTYRKTNTDFIDDINDVYVDDRKEKGKT